MRVGPVAPSLAPATRTVDATRTPASLTDIRAALSRALTAMTGRPPSAQTLDTLAGQVSLETAGGAQMFNFNFGGIKGVSPQGQTANYLTHEVIDGQSVKLQQGFRAYSSLDAGARDYVQVLKSRFPGAFAQALSGNVQGFAHALKTERYYTASEADYTAGLLAATGHSSIAAQPSGSVQPVPTDLPTTPELTRVLDALASTAARIAAPDPTD